MAITQMIHDAFLKIVMNGYGKLCVMSILLLSHTACAATPAIKTVEWKEEVKLNTGQIIIVERTQNYRSVSEPGAGTGWLFDKERIRATFGVAPGTSVTWEGVLRPLAIDITKQGVAYLVATAATFRGRQAHGIPEGAYHVAFKQESPGIWERISIDSVPDEFHPNLLISTYRLFITEQYRSAKVIDLSMKASVDSDPRIDPVYKTWSPK